MLIILTACQTPTTSPGGAPSSSPLPSLPGGGSAGAPTSPSQDSPMPPPSSEGSQSESESESDSSSSAESGGESSDAEQGETPPGWEDDTSIADGEAGSEGLEGEVTFEEPEGDVSFEEPDFGGDGGLTQEELEELEDELNESLGDFDEDIQREKTYAEERANDDAADNEGVGGVGAFETYKGDEESESDSNNSDQAASSQSSSESSAQSSSTESSSASSDNAGEVSGEATLNGEEIESNSEETVDLPPDIPEEIVNDDIVARQIREAAESETNPQLKEKLWAEYRKYKSQ